MTVTAWQIVAPMATTVTAPANTTQNAARATFEEYNNSEIEVIDIGRTYAPFLYTLTRMGRQLNGGQMKDLGVNEASTSNFPEFKWKERDEYNDIFTVNGTINSSATALVLTSTAGLYAGLILRDKQTDEHIRITAVVDATTLTIQRGVGETAAASITAADTLIVLGSASEDGASSTGSFFVANVDKSNYMQKVVTTISQTDFDRLSYKVGNYAQKLMAEKAQQHAKEKEMIALFGEKKSSTDPLNGKAFYTSGGLISHCKKGWTDDISSALTRNTFEEALEKPLLYGSEQKIIMCSSKVKRAIAGLYSGDLVLNDSLKDIDLTLETLKIDRGTFIFIIHPFLDSNSGYDNIAFILDPRHIKIVYPSASNEWGVNFGVDGKTKFMIDDSKTSPTYMEGSYYTYFTMELQNANSFWAIKVVA